MTEGARRRLTEGSPAVVIGLGGGGFHDGVEMLPTLPWGIDIRKSYGGTRADQRQVIELAAAGKISVDVAFYDLDDGPRAFDDLEAGTVTGRAILVP